MRLSTRLSLGLAISLALILTAQWFVMRHVFSDIATQQLVKKLVRDGEHLLANLSLDPHGALQLDETQLQAMYQRPFSGLILSCKHQPKTSPHAPCGTLL